MPALRIRTIEDGIERQAAVDGCWIWVAACFGDGYGSWKGKAAHRISYAQSNGPIPPGMSVLHRCDNPRCVNPAHLFLGTQRDNMRDMAAKGRCAGQKKTCCPKGHEYTPDNTYINRGHRFCRTCNRAAVDRYQQRVGR